MTGTLDDRLADWEARLDRLEAEPATRDYVLFVPSPAGYSLVERSGDPPAPGDRLEDDRYAVLRVVRSPLPGDGRSLVCLEAI